LVGHGGSLLFVVCTCLIVDMTKHGRIHTEVLSLVLFVLLVDVAFGVGLGPAGLVTQSQLVVITASILIGSLAGSDDERPVRVINSVPRDKARDRVRRGVESIFKEHGPYYVRRAYRMTEEAFWELHALLKPFMGSTRRKAGGKVQRHRNGGKNNGLICTETRLAVAIRYFAGGRPEDIAISHGISNSEVFYSVWKVVDAVNKCPDLVFGYPESYEKQRQLATAFQGNSSAGIDCCAGAIDGLLIWI
jgi:hypothetical protein